MTRISNLTTRNGYRFVLVVALSIIGQAVSAQTRYPLRTPISVNKLSARIQTERTIPVANSLQFSELPRISDPVEQQANLEPFLTNDSVAKTRELLTESFDSAYRNLDANQSDDDNSWQPSGSANHVDAPIPVPQGATGSVDASPRTILVGNKTISDNLTNRQSAFGDFMGSNTDGSSRQDSDSGSESPTWWKQQVLRTIGTAVTEQPVDTNSLVYSTLQNSPRIRAVSQNPLIRELQVIEADSDFDPTTFIRSQFQDRVDPVGDSLSITSDGSQFLSDHIWSGEMGVRKKLRTGAHYELGQTLGFHNSNSSFFTPQDQGTATLALNVTQPLMRGRGRYYNQSQILIAQSASGAAWDTFTAELQEEILETVTAYWELYSDRSIYLQKKRNVARGVEVLRILEGRKDLDSLPSQITRARSAVKSRKTDLANAFRDIRDSETEIRRLTADRDWQGNQNREMLPTETPSTEGLDIGLEQVVLTAIEHRPEIKETMARAKIAGIQRDISENELLPELSLLLGTYVSALKGDSNLGQAIQDQFGEVTPGYSVGLEFEFPFRNRAAHSRYTQRQLQLAKIRAEVDETMLNVIAESQISLRRVTSAKETLDAALQAIEAARADLEQNYRRWESFALIEGDIADGQTPTTALDQLLDSQERLTVAELVFTKSELELKTSEVELQRTMGTLLIHENVSFGKFNNGDVPEVIIDQAGDLPTENLQHRQAN